MTSPRLAAFLLGIVLVSPAPASAGPLSWLLDQAIGEGDMPPCHDPVVIARIQSKLRTADRHIFQHDLALVAIGHPKETRFTRHDPSPVARRYCEATAYLTNGQHPPLYYLIEQRLGFVGVPWIVEFCMPGYDPYRVYGGWCDTVRKDTVRKK